MTNQTSLLLFNNKQNTYSVFIYLLVISLIVRLPFLFVDVVDWDESTFILVSQALLDGHLPYTTLWDNKTPALFVIFAFIIFVFGKTTVGIRLAGILIVTIAAYQTFLIGSRLYTAIPAFIAASLSIIAVSFISVSSLYSGQATMSEHVALPFLLGSLLVLMDNTKPKNYLLAGVMSAVACLIRMNLAVIAVAICIFILLDRSHALKTRLRHALMFCSGGVLVVSVLALPYALSGKIGLFYFSVFKLPFVHAQTAQNNSLNAFKTHILSNSILIVTWIIGAIGAFLSTLPNKNWQMKSRDYALVITFTCAAIASVLASGAVFAHYLIQVLPFISILAGFFYQRLSGVAAKLAISVTIIWYVFVLSNTLTNSYAVWAKNLIEHGITTQGAATEVARFLAPRCGSDCKVYFLTDHLGYWLLGKQPPTPVVTHPSNIIRAYMLQADIGAEPTPSAEMTKILGTQPTFIVKRPYVWYFDLNADAVAARQVLERVLTQSYTRIATVSGVDIYRIVIPAQLKPKLDKF